MHICSVLFRPYDILPTRIVHANSDLRYLLNIDCGFNTWTCLFRFHSHGIVFLLLVHTAIKDLDLDLKLVLGLDLDLAIAGLDTSVYNNLDTALCSLWNRHRWTDVVQQSLSFAFMCEKNRQTSADRISGVVCWPRRSGGVIKSQLFAVAFWSVPSGLPASTCGCRGTPSGVLRDFRFRVRLTTPSCPFPISAVPSLSSHWWDARRPTTPPRKIHMLFVHLVLASLVKYRSYVPVQKFKSGICHFMFTITIHPHY